MLMKCHFLLLQVDELPLHSVRTKRDAEEGTTTTTTHPTERLFRFKRHDGESFDLRLARNDVLLSVSPQVYDKLEENVLLEFLTHSVRCLSALTRPVHFFS